MVTGVTMRSYRCYFLNLLSAIAGAEIVEAETDAEAVKRAEAVFREKGVGFSGIEVWDRGRRVQGELDDSLERIRRWRMKAEELRTAGEGDTGNPARQHMLHAADSYEVLANAAEARLPHQKDWEPAAE